jgi:hypothetical protein
LADSVCAQVVVEPQESTGARLDVQQLTKLAVSNAVDADVYIFLDSGAFFVRKYNPYSLLQGTRVPLFREQGPQLRGPHNTRWHQGAASVLGLSAKDSYDTSYVANLVFWKRDNLKRMQQHIENVTGSNWMLPLCRKTTLSEYVLYGQYCEEVLGEAAGHYPYSTINAYSYWDNKTLSEDDLRAIRSRLTPEQYVVMINEKSRTPIDRMRKVFVASAA